jgi:outer membrane protein insertion porin family
MQKMAKYSFLFFLFFLPQLILSQVIATDTEEILDYENPKDYEIGGITVIGAAFSDANAITSISGLKVGDKIKIPGPKTQQALKALWKLRLFTDVEIIQEKTLGDIVFLQIKVEERPRLSKYAYRGVKKGYHEDLNKEVDRFLLKGGIVTENVKTNAAEAVKKFLNGKGFLDAEVLAIEQPDSNRINSVQVIFDVTRGEKIKIYDIIFDGNRKVPASKLRSQFKETKRKRKFLSSSKLINSDYLADKEKLIDYYNKLGYRDAQILKDSIWRNNDGLLMIKIWLDEGIQYYYRNITWKGNSIYDESILAEVLGINTGDVYNQEELKKRLQFSQDGRDVSTLYMDYGYLFFNVDPIEIAVKDDSIDIEIRIFEGPQATIDKVMVEGNDRTHEHVIRRELRTRPAEKFSRSDIIRSQREIINLNYFNQEALGINTPVNPQRGTVDIEYTVEERPADQLELSAGWGGNRQVIGTLGVSFNNFSLRNIFNKKAWHPLPMGDGQRFSIRAQSNGNFYQSYNVSLTEPWLGGKKPTSFTVGSFFNRFGFGRRSSIDYQNFDIRQIALSLGTRLKWPDDNFISSTSINFQTLTLNNWQRGLFRVNDGSVVSNGNFNNFSIRQSISRSTVNDPIFPREGATISLSVQFTPPYSIIDRYLSSNPKDYSDMPNNEKFKFLEYHKWRFDADWFTTIVGKLVLKTQAKIGILSYYNKDIGTAPFERFQLGGDGINNQQFGFQGVDIISLRGYEIEDIEANLDANGGNTSAPVYDKFTLELRYPFSLNPTSTIFITAFAQGGNSWRTVQEFNPFDLKRSAGMGVRVFLPMFGILGFDYGVGFDKQGPRTLSNLATFNIVLGFEPE